jgi:hypothetical protein
MSAQIIPFRRPIEEADFIADLPMSFIASLPQPANTLTIDAVPVDVTTGTDTLVTASMALSVACREMAASLAILVAHCEFADGVMTELSDGAQSMAGGGGAIIQAAACLENDIARGAGALAMAARAGTKS